MKQPNIKRKYALRSVHDVSKLRFKTLTQKEARVFLRSKKGKEKALESSNSYHPTKQQQAQMKAAFEKS